MPTVRDETLDAGPGVLDPEERSAVAGIRGLRWWVVVLVALVLAVGGMTVDLARVGELGIVYTVCFPVGAILAAVWVRRGEMFATWVQPPLLLAVGVPVAVVAGGALPPTGGLTAKILAVGGPLINGFPVMAITTAVCLAVAFVRSRLQPLDDVDDLPGPDDPDRTVRPSASARRPEDRRPEDRRPDDRRRDDRTRDDRTRDDRTRDDRTRDDRRRDDRRPERPARPDDRGARGERPRPDDRRRPDERRPDERRGDDRRREPNRPARPARPDEPTRRDAPGPGVYRVPKPGGARPDDQRGPSVPRERPARRPGPPPDGA